MNDTDNVVWMVDELVPKFDDPDLEGTLRRIKEEALKFDRELKQLNSEDSKENKEGTPK